MLASGHCNKHFRPHLRTGHSQMGMCGTTSAAAEGVRVDCTWLARLGKCCVEQVNGDSLAGVWLVLP